MPFDSNGADPHHMVDLGQALGGFYFDREYMLPSGCCPVLIEQPFLGLILMSLSQHAPELSEDIVVDAAEGLRCHHVAVVMRPASKRRIELLDQGRHRGADVCADYCSHLADEGEDSLG